MNPKIPHTFFQSPHDGFRLVGPGIDIAVPLMDRYAKVTEKTDQIIVGKTFQHFHDAAAAKISRRGVIAGSGYM
jgi:hypothetical protein